MISEWFFRWFVAAALFLSGAVSSFFLRKTLPVESTQRQREGERWMYAARSAAGLFLLVIFILYIAYPDALAWAVIHLPLWLRIVSAGLALGCIPLFIWIFRSLGKNVTVTVRPGDAPTLVQEGPYRFVRHPLYATMLVLIGSLGAVAQNWVLLLFFAAGWIIFRYLVVPVEEAHLEEVFGEAYRAYRESTGAMFPRLF